MELGTPDPEAFDTTPERVIAFLDEFAGRPVRIKGWISLRDEHVAIESSREVALLSCSSDTIGDALRRSLWLDFRNFPTRGADVWKVLGVQGMGAWGPGLVEGIVDPDEHEAPDRSGCGRHPPGSGQRPASRGSALTSIARR